MTIKKQSAWVVQADGFLNPFLFAFLCALLEIKMFLLLFKLLIILKRFTETPPRIPYHVIG
jgi:hypothetical protein